MLTRLNSIFFSKESIREEKLSFTQFSAELTKEKEEEEEELVEEEEEDFSNLFSKAVFIFCSIRSTSSLDDS